MLTAALANRAWLVGCYPGWRRFDAAAQRVAAVQATLLRGYLSRNPGTDYGRRYGFAEISSYADFARRVPLTTYDDYAADLEANAAGRPGVLTAEPVRLFEFSSGSTAGSKLIPYTATLQAEFQRGVTAWIYNTYTHCPALLDGPAYWSLSPLTQGRQMTPGGIPIGFEEDSAYLGGLSQRLVELALATPNAVKQVGEMAAFRYVTLRYLLGCPELRLISIWNPTFLPLLLQPLADWWGALLADLAQGTLTPPSPLPTDLQAALARRLRPQPGRAQALAQSGPADYRALWPRLTLLSCWADGPAAEPARQLAAAFPGVALQPKGLLATEGCVSFPVWGQSGSVLAVNAHFFEFLPEDEPESTPRLAHELEVGRRYAVALTTGGGFYRYQLQDLVEVLGHYHQAPRLRFVGKLDHISDWFGEKLSEAFVAGAVDRALQAKGVRAEFALLAPEAGGGERGAWSNEPQTPKPGEVGYVLFVEAEGEVDWAGLGEAVEEELRANFHYAYCRQLGQLRAAAARRAGPQAAAHYLEACQAKGQRLGNIKPGRLQKTGGWGRWLEAR